LISAAAIGFELLLVRLFAIIQWHHYAAMVISLALLGYGASGTFLALAGATLTRCYLLTYTACATGFGLSALSCFLLAQRLPFNALELPWDPLQPLWLMLVYLTLMVPFFLAATCVGLTFMRYRGCIARVYSFDLIGAAGGTVALVGVLFLVPANRALELVAAVGPLAAALAWLGSGARPRWVSLLLALLTVVLVVGLPPSWVALNMSPYKELRQALRVAGATVVASRSSPLGQLTVVHNPVIPFRYVPGLSLNTLGEATEQLAIFIDGDGSGVIAGYRGQPGSLSYLDDTTAALPYHLLQQPRVLVLGAGGGAAVLQALYHQARRVEAVELNSQLVGLVRREFGEFAGNLYRKGAWNDRVRVHIAEARSFVAQSRDHYDLILVELGHASAAAAGGLSALSESYLLTVEALAAYLERLAPGGLLTLSRGSKLPPRDSVKLFATAVAALERTGEREPWRRLAWIRGWDTSTLIVKNGPFSDDDVATVGEFCQRRSFDVIYYPGVRSQDLNRFNQLDRPYFFDAARALLGPDRERFLDQYKFAVTPATDNRPYFFDFFKWYSIPEILSSLERGGVGLIELGYVVLVATLLQAVVASVVLIVLPLHLARLGARRSVRSLRVLGYFVAIGLGFIFVEIAFVQKLTLFLGHPLYAVAVVLAGFLAFAGLGSRRVAVQHGTSGGDGAVVALLATAILAVTCYALLPHLLSPFLGSPELVKVALALTLIAPLAFSMGRPFPLGMARLEARAPGLIPWAWGVNGCASVVAAVLAKVIAMHFGMTSVIVLAGLFYCGAASFALRD
jgi:hypothetical protein